MHNDGDCNSRDENVVGGGGGRAKSRFKFITALPQSDLEKRENRTIVRANASSFHWRHARKPDGRHKSERRLSKHGGRAQRRQSLRVIAPVPPSSTDVTLPSSDAEQAECQQLAFSDPKLIRSDSRVGNAPNSPGFSIPILCPGGEFLDSLDVFPSNLPQHIVLPLLHQSLLSLKQAFPAAKGCTDNEVVHTWFTKALSDKGLFHTFLFVELTKNLANNRVRDGSREQLYCYSEAIKEINRKFGDGWRACEDENILSVLCLAYNGEAQEQDTTPAPTQGPLKSLQILDVYGGRLDTVQLHFNGLARMVALRGGLDRIQLPGLAQSISYASTITACRSLTRPSQPFISDGADLDDALSRIPRIDHPRHTHGAGFSVLYKVLKPQQFFNLSVVLRRLGEYTMAVDDYAAGRPEAQGLAELANQRNYVQHTLMEILPDEESDSAISSLCQLAAVVYSFLVVFPLPRPTAPFKQLARKMRDLFMEDSVDETWSQAPQLMVWMVTMASLAAVGRPERAEYIVILDRLIRRLKIESWVGFKGTLESFLWYGSVSDSDGYEIWEEIEKSSPFDIP